MMLENTLNQIKPLPNIRHSRVAEPEEELDAKNTLVF